MPSQDLRQDLLATSAVDLARAIADRQVSCRELMAAHLAQVDRLNPVVNAIVSRRDPDELLRDAAAADDALASGRRRGALHGMPQAIKDLSPARGIPFTQGSPLFADFVPAADNITVERMRAAGAILVGKTNVPEFGFGSQTFNPVFGATLNAFDQTKTAGGSSGGAAVALALDMLPVADGSDNGGSLRNPAGWNNVFGLRPCFGRVPTGGDEVFLPSLGVAGPMARNVPDLAMLLAVQAGYDARVPNAIEEDPAVFTRPLDGGLEGLRIGWLRDWGGRIPFEPGMLDLCEAALRAMEEAGATVETVTPDFSMDRIFDDWCTLRAWGIAASLGPLVADPEKRALVKPEAQWEADRGVALTAEAVHRASVGRTAWYGAARQLFERFDHLVLPTAQVFPFAVETRWPGEVGGRAMDTYHRWMEVAVPFTMANAPTINVPVGFNADGLPAGMQIAGRNHAEWQVLKTAHAYDRATGWTKRRSPLLG